MPEELLRRTKIHQDFQRERQNLSHAYFILSPDIRAVHELFRLLAQEIQCKNGGCSECPTCRKIDENVHADVKFYENSSKMTVKEAEALIEDTYLKSVESGKKLYFLERADGMNQAVQNKLLKTYEEPPENVVIFLHAASESAVLPTIRSRAKKFYLQSFTAQELEEELLSQEMDKLEAETVAFTAAGSLTDALRFAADEGFLSRYREVFELLLNLKKSPQIVNFVGSPLFQKENFPLTLDFIERILWDSVRAKTELSDDKISAGRKEDYNAIGDAVSYAAAAMISELINEARKKISLNISSLAAAESLLFGILEAKYKWQ